MLAKPFKRGLVVFAALLSLSCTQPGAAVSTPAPTGTPPATLIPPTALPQPAAAEDYHLDVSAPSIEVGKQLVVTVTRSGPSGACQFLAYDMTLLEGADGIQHLTFDSPDRLGPPAPATGVYTLTGSLAGDTQLRASVYGETDCGNGFQWSTRQSNTVTVTVEPARQAFLPVITR